MSAPQQRQPARNDEALDILRRLEPTLTRIETDIAKVTADVARIEVEQRRQGGAIDGLRTEQQAQAVALARLDGQLKAVPSIWQIVTVVGMVNGIALALATYLRH